jgi:hypothetical protein
VAPARLTKQHDQEVVGEFNYPWAVTIATNNL